MYATLLSVAIVLGKLHGTLELPAGSGAHPVVLIIAGSGPTDREGNGMGATNDSLKLLAKALADAGVASVRYDKRGIGESKDAAPPEDQLRFDTYSDDAADWVAMLRGDARFSSVSIIGHSEGALLGMIAAQRGGVARVVSIAGAGRAANVVLREQLSKNLQGALQLRALEILAELEAGRTVADVPPELAALFRPSVQPYLISWFARDPVKEIAKVSTPVAIVQGTTDIQISITDADTLAAAKPTATKHIIDGMNHVLKAATLDPADQQAAYTDPTRPLHLELIKVLTTLAF